MEPVAKQGYTPSEKEMMDKANKLLSDARLILEGKLEVNDPYYGTPLPALESLNKALIIAREGFDITQKYRPGAETVITVIDEIKQKIEELKKPAEPEPSKEETPEPEVPLPEEAPVEEVPEAEEEVETEIEEEELEKREVIPEIFGGPIDYTEIKKAEAKTKRRKKEVK